MINTELKQKLNKVYALVKQGTDGEKQAAQNALDRLLEKYNLQGIDLNSLDKEIYCFKYKTTLDEQLFVRILKIIVGIDDLSSASKDTWHKREIQIQLTYLDYITLSASYEYFKKHMKAQWDKVCAPELKRCRKAKTRNARRKQLQEAFFNRYIINSKLYKESELTTVDYSTKSDKEKRDRYLMEEVEGGAYNKQMVGGKFLEA